MGIRLHGGIWCTGTPGTQGVTEGEVAMDKRTALVIGEPTTLTRDEADCFNRAGISITSVRDLDQAHEVNKQMSFGVAVMDLSMIKLDQPSLIDGLERIDSSMPIIAFGDAHDFKLCRKRFDSSFMNFLPRSIDANSLLCFIEHALSRSDVESAASPAAISAQVSQPQQKEGEHFVSAKIPDAHDAISSVLVGNSEAICCVRRQIEEVANTDVSVLIEGETGTGKDVIARMIHKLSGRTQTGAFVKIACPALAEGLLESDLFGHEAGAFTGAVKQKPGRFELAKHGTLFLDEVTEMPLNIQAKLLEAMEHKIFTRVGGSKSIRVETRIVTATNAIFHELFEKKQFRQDLYFRMNQYSVRLPPLRERTEDIPLLVTHFLKKYGRIYGNPDLKISTDALYALGLYDWPGNVRELESAVRRFALTGKEEKLYSAFLSEPQQAAATVSAPDGTYKQSEKKVIMGALMRARWNRRRAAEELGISYNTLRRRIQHFGLACDS